MKGGGSSENGGSKHNATATLNLLVGISRPRFNHKITFLSLVKGADFLKNQDPTCLHNFFRLFTIS